MANLGQAISEALAGALAGYAQGYTGQNYLQGVLDIQQQRRESVLKEKEMVFDIAKAKMLKGIDIAGARQLKEIDVAAQKDIAGMQLESTKKLATQKHAFDKELKAIDFTYEQRIRADQEAVDTAKMYLQASLDTGKMEEAAKYEKDLVRLRAKLAETAAKAESERTSALSGVQRQFITEERVDTQKFQAEEREKDREAALALTERAEAHSASMARLQGTITQKTNQLAAARAQDNQIAVMNLQHELDTLKGQRTFAEQKELQQSAQTADAKAVATKQLHDTGLLLFQETGDARFLQPWVDDKMQKNVVAPLPEDATTLQRVTHFINGFINTSAEISQVVTNTQLARDKKFKGDYQDRADTIVATLEPGLSESNPEAALTRIGIARETLRKIEFGFTGGERGNRLTDDGKESIREITNTALKQLETLEMQANDALKKRDFDGGDTKAIGPQLKRVEGPSEVLGVTSRFAREQGEGISEQEVKRLYEKSIEEYQPTWASLNQILAFITTEGQDRKIEDIADPSIKMVLENMQADGTPGPPNRKLFDHLMNNRDDAENTFAAVKKLSDVDLSNVINEASKASTKRAFGEKEVRLLDQLKISTRQGKATSLKDAGFEFNSEWVQVVTPSGEGAEPQIQLVRGKEVELVNELIRAGGYEDVLWTEGGESSNPSSALAIVNAVKSLGTRLNFSEEDKIRLLREVTPKFDEVETAAFLPGASFITIGNESNAIDENPIVELYYNRSNDFSARVGNVFGEGLSTNEKNARFWESKNWVRELRNTVDPVVRQEIYKRYGLEDYYDENIDAFLIEGGSHFGNKAILAALPTQESEAELDIYRQKRDNLELEMTRLEAEGKKESQEYKAKATEHAKLGIVADTDISETNVNDARRLYAGLGRAICLGEAEVLTYMKLHRKADTGFDLVGDDDALEAEIKAAYRGDFENTLGEMLSIYLPAATMEGRTTAGKADFIEFINATYPHVAKAVEAASQYDPGTVPVLIDTNWWNTKRDVKFRNLSYLFSTSEDLTEFER